MTATEVAEQGWVHAERAAGLAEGGALDLQAAVDRLRAAAAAERDPRFAVLHAEALARGVTITYDDDALSLGAGCGSRTWPRAELPAPPEVPWAGLREIPVALVTGSNGKTTTTRLLAALLRAAGHVTGLCSTDGVRIGDAQVESGDWAGPAGARRVLRDPAVQAAALETARGGILRRGLATRRADAAIVLNISADHFGEYGVHDLESLAHTKLVVGRPIGPAGRLVLNADDPTLLRLGPAERAPILWISQDGAHPHLTRHVARGGDACVVAGDVVRLHRGGRWEEVCGVADILIAAHGAARHNVENALGAIALAATLGVPLATMREVLPRFGERLADNPGRMNRLQVGGVTAIVDFAHNPAGVAALAAAARDMPARRRLVILGQAGNRDDAAIRELARAAWETVGAPGHFDRVLLKEMAGYRRGRGEYEIPGIMAEELRRLGAPAEAIEVCESEFVAVQRAFAWAEPGDLLLLTVHAERPRVVAWLDGLVASGWRPGEELPGEGGGTG